MKHIKSDIEIANSIKLKNIKTIAKNIGIIENEIELYGRYKAKISLKILDRLKTKTNGKLVVVTSINPTPLGEGKTVTTIGASLGLAKINKKVFTCIRQPSMGPIFGIKGGAAGGGYSQVIPMEELNINLTGDIHAITTAHNLAAAAIDARLYHELRNGYKDFEKRTGLKSLKIDQNNIFWKRVLDINDRALRNIEIGLPSKNSIKNQNGIPRHTSFEISVASELMAILALSTDLQDMRNRIGKIIMALDIDEKPITAEELKIAGAMTAIMKDTIKPNLMQTTEYTPCFIHAGPFANIAHGNSSIISDKIALKLADYVITEAGFGSDMGFEKFCNIKTRYSGIYPSAAVIVCTVRALKSHSSKFTIIPGKKLNTQLFEENIDAVKEGLENLKAHIEHIRLYGIPIIVSINRFPTDTEKEIDLIKKYSIEYGAFKVCVSDVFSLGGYGGIDLAESIVDACNQKSSFKFLYDNSLDIIEKIKIISQKVYNAKDIEFSEQAKQQINNLNKNYNNLPICMAKTQYSLSHDPNLKGAPKDFIIPIKEVHLASGAGFIYVLTGEINTMPGLGSKPNYMNIDIDKKGNIIGLS